MNYNFIYCMAVTISTNGPKTAFLSSQNKSKCICEHLGSVHDFVYHQQLKEEMAVKFTSFQDYCKELTRAGHLHW